MIPREAIAPKIGLVKKVPDSDKNSPMKLQVKGIAQLAKQNNKKYKDIRGI
jgi:hypothetical protein